MSMLFMVALALGAPGAEAPQKDSQHAKIATDSDRSAASLRRAVHAALRREALAKGTDHDRAALELAQLLRPLVADERMARGERKRLLTKVSARIRNLEEAQRRRILGQIGFGQNGPAVGAAGNKDNSEDLAELIRTSIAPESWVEAGGNGVIVVFGR
jgi:hypothetical protein